MILQDGRGGALTLSEPLAFYIFFVCVCVHKNAKRVSQKPSNVWFFLSQNGSYRSTRTRIHVCIEMYMKPSLL